MYTLVMTTALKKKPVTVYLHESDGFPHRTLQDPTASPKEVLKSGHLLHTNPLCPQFQSKAISLQTECAQSLPYNARRWKQSGTRKGMMLAQEYFYSTWKVHTDYTMPSAAAQ